MVLSLFGWAIGLLAVFSVIFNGMFGTWIIYRSRKLNANLLTIMGLAIIFTGLGYLGVLIDFLTMLTTETHMNKLLFAQISYSLSAVYVFLYLYIYAKLMIQEKIRKYFISFYLTLTILILIIIFIDPINSFNITLPGEPNEVLMQSSLAFMSPAFFLGMFVLISIFIFCVIGYFYKSMKSSGILRKKYLYLSIGYMFWTIGGSVEGLMSSGIFIIFVRISMSISALFYYFGIREEPEKKEKIKPKKEIKVKGDLFRISQYKKEDITEEEVSISKEKKICLVCKGKVLGNTYICTECEAFYCMKCSQAISNSENACWACNSPIDKSKPVKPFKREEEEIEISEKP
jgi:hypothetical protein